MIKLDNSIMQDIECEELRGYWSDFDAGNYAFTMEVEDIGLDELLNDIIQLMEDIE